MGEEFALVKAFMIQPPELQILEKGKIFENIKKGKCKERGSILQWLQSHWCSRNVTITKEQRNPS